MKLLKLLAVLLITSLFLFACTPASENDTQGSDQDRLHVITSIFPQYDFVRQIAGDKVELSMLLSLGGEAHAFDPSPQDIIALNNADLFIYVGGHIEHWLDTILESIDQQNLHTVSLLDLLDIHCHEHDHGHHGHGHDHGHHDHGHDHEHHDHGHDHGHHDHGHDHGHHDHGHDHEHHDHGHHDHGHHDHGHHDNGHHDHGHHDHGHHDHGHHDHGHHDHGHDHVHGTIICAVHDHHHDFDEHVWTSPQNAILIVQALTEVLAELDPDNAEYFRQNAVSYLVQLLELDRAFTEVVAQSTRQTVIFGDRFPFRHLMHTYGLSYYAAFPGCSAETQASPATIAFLIDKVNEEQIPVVFYIEFSTRLIANVIAEATGAQLLELHSVHNISHADYTAGVTYLELMTRNVEHLRKALN